MKFSNRVRSQGRALAGYSLPETIIAVSLVGMMFVSLYAGFSAGFAILRSARENLRATEILNEQTERIRLLSWSQILDPAQYLPATFVAPFNPEDDVANPSGLLYQVGLESVTPTDWPAAYQDRIRLVTITLTWTNSDGHTPRVSQRQVQTSVSRYGMQNYFAAP